MLRFSIKKVLIFLMPFFGSYINTPHYGSNFWEYLKFRLGLSKLYWPKCNSLLLSNPRKVYVGINSIIGRECSYIQGQGKVFIGNYVQFGPNVGIISANHDLYDQRLSENKQVTIGDYCWVGMNSVVLPGVLLGTRTIVAAGSVVTKSFPEGFCVIGGNPARLIKSLEKEKFIPWKDKHEFYGFIPKKDFEKKKKKYIDI